MVPTTPITRRISSGTHQVTASWVGPSSVPVPATSPSTPPAKESAMASHYLQDVTENDIVLEALPDDVVASMESRDRWTTSLENVEGGLEFLVADLQSWTPGQTVRVAFLGG